MNKSELAIIIILQLIGISGLFAIPCIFLPYDWMNYIHEHAGLGEMPNTPIVSYLARSLSMFYGVVAGLMLYISCDIRRYRSLIKLWSVIAIIGGFVLLGIDFASGMPPSWTWCEGPPTSATGGLIFWLQQRIRGE